MWSSEVEAVRVLIRERTTLGEADTGSSAASRLLFVIADADIYR